jgi:hypothetical protein
LTWLYANPEKEMIAEMAGDWGIGFEMRGIQRINI